MGVRSFLSSVSFLLLISILIGCKSGSANSNPSSTLNGGQGLAFGPGQFSFRDPVNAADLTSVNNSTGTQLGLAPPVTNYLDLDQAKFAFFNSRSNVDVVGRVLSCLSGNIDPVECSGFYKIFLGISEPPVVGGLNACRGIQALNLPLTSLVESDLKTQLVRALLSTNSSSALRIKGTTSNENIFHQGIEDRTVLVRFKNIPSDLSRFRRLNAEPRPTDSKLIPETMKFEIAGTSSDSESGSYRIQMTSCTQGIPIALESISFDRATSKYHREVFENRSINVVGSFPLSQQNMSHYILEAELISDGQQFKINPNATRGLKFESKSTYGPQNSQREINFVSALNLPSNGVEDFWDFTPRVYDFYQQSAFTVGYSNPNFQVPPLNVFNLSVFKSNSKTLDQLSVTKMKSFSYSSNRSLRPPASFSRSETDFPYWTLNEFSFENARYIPSGSGDSSAYDSNILNLIQNAFIHSREESVELPLLNFIWKGRPNIPLTFQIYFPIANNPKLHDSLAQRTSCSTSAAEDILEFNLGDMSLGAALRTAVSKTDWQAFTLICEDPASEIGRSQESLPDFQIDQGVPSPSDF